MKVCTKCKIEKEDTEFYASKINGKLYSSCKGCEKIRRVKSSIMMPIYRKKWNDKNPCAEDNKVRIRFASGPVLLIAPKWYN